MRQHADMATKAACVQFSLTPLGFHGWADRYFQDYGDLAQSSRDSPVAVLLLCRAIELDFKAWHRHTSKRNLITNTFGHDLLASYRALPAKRRILSAEEVVLLTRANEVYGKQGFEQIGVDRAGHRFEQRLNLAALEAMMQKIMEHGDRMNLGQE